MAIKLVTQAICDGCLHFDIPNVPAVVEYRLSINDGPRRKVQLCQRCDVVWEPLIEVVAKWGQDDPAPTEEPKRSTKKKPKAVKAAEPKELEAVPTPAPEKPKQYLMCPLPHPSEGGGPKRVTYNDRQSHAEMLHHGAKIWDIAWEDPDHIITAHCDGHAECMKTGLGFTTKVGVAQHKRGCPLPRIDGGAGPAATTDKSHDERPIDQHSAD